jgi:hypothetical protein
MREMEIVPKNAFTFHMLSVYDYFTKGDLLFFIKSPIFVIA